MSLQSGAAMTSESKHTPGPWMVREAADFLQIAPPDNSEPICEMGLYPAPDWPKDEAAELMANARLIASAPELLEALEAFAKHFGPLHDNEWLNDECRHCFKLARNALSRVRGET